MKTFCVWTRPLQSTSRVRVEGRDNASWLLRRLSQSFYFKSSEPIHELVDLSCWFEVPYGADASGLRFEKLLARIPEVTLLREPRESPQQEGPLRQQRV